MQIDLPESLVKRLQSCATPFVDTPVTVIERWANFYEQNFPAGATVETKSKASSVSSKLKQFNPKQPPNLLHTRVIGEFGEYSFNKWNDLMRMAHVCAMNKAKTFEELKKVTHAQIRKGEYTEDGFSYLKGPGISIQGVDANRAWEYSLRLAIYLKVPIRVEVEWRHNEKAEYPGEKGVLIWEP